MTETSRLTDDDRFLIAEARRIGPALRARISDQERLAGEVIGRLADLAERLGATSRDEEAGRG
jgi:hypothetical protein